MTDRDPQRDAIEEEFERLLGEAEWPEPDPQAIERLQQHWTAVRARSVTTPRRRRFRLAVMAAATVLTAVGGWWLLSERRDAAAPDQGRAGPRVVRSDRPPTSETDGHRSVETLPVAGAPVARSASRPATILERLVVRTVERRDSPTKREAAASQAALEQLLADPDADPDVFLAACADPQICERQLLATVEQASAAQRVRIIELLSRVGSQRAVPALLRLAARQETRDAAVRCLRSLADAPTLARLARQASDRELCGQLAGELLARDDPRAIEEYLGLVADRRTMHAALAALRDQIMPPVQALFRYMQSDAVALRLAAAIALARLDRPEVTQRLIQLAHSPAHRQEALMALLVSPADEAAQFLNAARRDRAWFVAVNTAQHRWQSISQLQGRPQ